VIGNQDHAELTHTTVDTPLDFLSPTIDISACTGVRRIATIRAESLQIRGKVDDREVSITNVC